MNVIDFATREPLKSEPPSNGVKSVLDRVAAYAGKTGVRTVAIVMIDSEGEHVVDYFVQPEDFSMTCLVLGDLADEMCDAALGNEDG